MSRDNPSDVELGHCRANGVYYCDEEDMCKECTHSENGDSGNSLTCDECMHNDRASVPDDELCNNFTEHPCVSCSSRGRRCSGCGEAR